MCFRVSALPCMYGPNTFCQAANDIKAVCMHVYGLLFGPSRSALAHSFGMQRLPEQEFAALLPVSTAMT